MTEKRYQGGDATQALGAVVTTSGPTTTAATSGAAPLLPECSITLTTTGGDVLVVFTGTFTHSAATIVTIELRLDGSFWNWRYTTVGAGTAYITLSMVESFRAVDIPAGTHTLAIYYYSTAGATLTAVGQARDMMVVEFRR
jgi:hypothetical protein